MLRVTTGPAAERQFPNSVLLSRSRYYAPANHSLRFYREYVQADSETTIVKERLRWHIDYQGERYYINIDMLSDPASDQYFIEIKSRTWSLSDAEHKAETISTILEHLEIPHADLIHAEYPVMSDK